MTSHRDQNRTDNSGALAHNTPMSQATWFWQKAEQCTRMAENASEPDTRGDYETQARHWRQMAAQIETKERNRLGSDTKLTMSVGGICRDAVFAKRED
jgi:hypothetical protein